MGEQSIRFAVHANLLATQSLSFAQKLQNNYNSSIESSTTVELPSIDPNIFDLILTWIYTRQLPHAGVDDDCCGIRDDCLLLSCESSKVQLIQLFLMAEVLGVESLVTVITNIVIEFTIRAFVWPFSPNQIALLWQRVPAQRKMSTELRRLLVDFFALTRRTGIRDFGPNTKGCEQFLFEVGCLRERSYNLGLPFWDKKTWTSQGNWCKKYHEHFCPRQQTG